MDIFRAALPRLCCESQNMIRLNINANLIRTYCTSNFTLKDVIVQRDLNKKVKVQGWIKTVRAMKELIFADINDGSTGENLQIVCNKSEKAKLGFGSSVEATGTLDQTPKGQLELKVDNLKQIGECPLDGTFPYVARQSYAPEYIRENLHLRSRVSSFNSMMRCRHNLTNIINNYLDSEGFMQVHTPILTGKKRSQACKVNFIDSRISANDCEGAGEVFTVKPDSENLLKTMKRNETDPPENIYFNRKTFLTVSGQLHLEAMAHGLRKVYAFGPTFRAENSKSAIHLSEFYMLELEESFIDSLDDVVGTISRMFRSVSREFASKSSDDVLRLNKSDKSFSLDEHFKWLDKDFPVLTFNEAFGVIEQNKEKFKKPPNFDDGLSKEQELFLADYCSGPCFVIDWPKSQKSFYMRQKKENPDIVEALDFLVPQVGEVAGGSVREDDFDVLKAKMPADENLQWYLNLRKYGSVTTGGFGLGFERYLQFLLKIHSIKDVIPFPRWPHNCSM